MPELSPITSIARQLAAALKAAAAGNSAHDAPQRTISELHEKLVEAFNDELSDAVVRI